ncbi:hypothetical protein DL765_002994 [Monosporascus sp. GIB2]|nr:hypothetical protein DL765_002994 [Monosporascus sp. GIB2]
MSSERRSLFDPPQTQAEVIQENLNRLKQQEAIAKVRLESAKRLADRLEDESWHVKRSRQRREKRHRLETRRKAVEAHRARQRAAVRRARRERGATVTPSPTPSEAEAETVRQAAARAARKVRAARRGHRRSVATLLLADAYALQWREVTMADASGHWVRGAREQHGGRPRDHFAMAVRRTSSLTSNELLVRNASKWINKRHSKAARRRRGEDDVSGGGGGSGRGDDSDGDDDGGDDGGDRGAMEDEEIVDDGNGNGAADGADAPDPDGDGDDDLSIATDTSDGGPDGNTGSKKPEKTDAVRRLRNEEEEEAERDRNATVQKFRQIMESKGWRPDARVSSATPRPPPSPEEGTEEEEALGDEGAEGIPTSSDPSPDKGTEQPPENPEEEDDGDVLAKIAIIRASVEDEDSNDSSEFDKDEGDASEESEHGYDELDRELGEHNDEWWDDLGKVAQAYASEFTAPEYEWPSESINAMGAVATRVEPGLSGVASTRRTSSSSGNTCKSNATSTALPFMNWVLEKRNPQELESALDKAYRGENDNAKSRERRRATGEALSATPESPSAGYTRVEYDTNLEDLSSASKSGEHDSRHYKAEDIHNRHLPGNLGPNIPGGDGVLSYPVGARTPDPNVYDPVNWEKHVDLDEVSLHGGKWSPRKQDIRVKDGAWMSWEETSKAYPRLDDIRRLDHAWESLAAIQPSENMSNEEMMDIAAVTIKHWPTKAAYIGPESTVSEAVFFPLDANDTASARRRLPALPAAPEPIKGLSIQGPPEPASQNWGYGGSAEAPRIKVEDEVTGRPLRPLPTEEEIRNATPINNDIFPKMPPAPEKQKGEDELRERLREIRQREEEDARRQEEARGDAEEEARRKAEEDAHRQAAARQKAEEEAARRAEEARKEAARRQAAARRKAEEEAARQAEEARKEAARQNEEEEARRQAAARQKAEEAARQADEARKEEARRDTGESQRQTQQTTGPNNSEDVDQRAADIAEITEAVEDNTALKALLKLMGPFNMDEIADRYVAYRAAIRRGLEPESGTEPASDTGNPPSLAEFMASLPPEERANEELAQRRWLRLVFKSTRPKPKPEPKNTAATDNKALVGLFHMDKIAERYGAYEEAIRKGLEPEAGTKHGRDDEDGQAGGDSKRTKLASDTGTIPSPAEFKDSPPLEEQANDELAEGKWHRLVFGARKPEPEPKTPDHAPPPPPGSSDNATAQAQETAGDTDFGSTENILNDPEYTELLIQQTLLPGLSEAAGDSDSHDAATATTHHRQTGGLDYIRGIDDDGGDENGDEDEADALFAKKNVLFDLGRNEEYDDDDDDDCAFSADGRGSSDGSGRGGGGGRDDYGYYGGRISGAGRSRLGDGANRAARRAIYNLDTDPWKPSFDSYWKQGEERRVAAPPEESGEEKEEREIDWLFG